jgi:glyoxylase I family protein
MTKLHHAAICTTDIEGGLRFWRDGLGFEVQMDERFSADWPTLFGAGTDQLRSVFLGDPTDPDAGIVELVEFDPIAPGTDAVDTPAVGFFLLSLWCDLDPTLARLADLGLGGPVRRIEVQGVAMATVRDPNGVLVELLDRGPA